MTLEMPFKIKFDLPDPAYGWSPQRSKYWRARASTRSMPSCPSLRRSPRNARRTEAALELDVGFRPIADIPLEADLTG
jgi:hypothetical protein